MSKKKIQIIINIVTIINIIIIILVGYRMTINNRYSRRYVNELVERNINSDNFILEKEQNLVKEGKVITTRIIQKENARREEVFSNGEITKIIWYANDLVITQNANEKNYFKQKIEETDINGNKRYRYMTTEDVLSYSILRNDFKCPNYMARSENYKYLKKEKYNEVECIIVQFNNIIEDYDAKIWIDLDTGFELKEELYLQGVLESVTKYNVETNIVTDKEIDLPDLEEYTFIET